MQGISDRAHQAGQISDPAYEAGQHGPASLVTPPAPQPTVQTVDTLSVSGNLKFRFGPKVHMAMVLKHSFRPSPVNAKIIA